MILQWVRIDDDVMGSVGGEVERRFRVCYVEDTCWRDVKGRGRTRQMGIGPIQ